MPAPGELIMVEPKRPKPPKHWSDWTVEERKAQVVELGLPGFRADQFSRQWYQRLNNDTASWTDVPADMREAVKDLLFPDLMTSIRELKCDNGTTVKQVWKLFDGVLVESVLMRYTDRTTMCISSQAGCGMNCPFCATGQSGLTRNLSTAEIVEQVLAGARSLAKGEIEGGIRGITVSTVGLVPRMRQLAEEGIPVTLAVSLHAPDDELRDTLVPINTRFKVQEVLDAAWYYADKTGRRISIEYAMIKDINDQAWRADLLGEKLAGNLVHVNLIPLNPTPGSKWTASRPEDEAEFVRRLKSHGVPVTVRDTRGRDIDGACGQLAAATKD
jgi:23S rRNA (adenine2503-C2)-methyltransferase